MGKILLRGAIAAAVTCVLAFALGACTVDHREPHEGARQSSTALEHPPSSSLITVHPIESLMKDVVEPFRTPNTPGSKDGGLQQKCANGGDDANATCLSQHDADTCWQTNTCAGYRRPWTGNDATAHSVPDESLWISQAIVYLQESISANVWAAPAGHKASDTANPNYLKDLTMSFGSRPAGPDSHTHDDNYPADPTYALVDNAALN